MEYKFPINRHNIFTALGVMVNVIFCILTIIGAYGGYIYPSVMPLASIIVMVFPIIVVADVALIALDLILCRKLAWVPAVAMLMSAGAIFVTSPVTFPHGKPDYDEERRMFTVLTYNTLNFIDNQDIYPDSTNRTLSYILSTDADIVCLQECGFIGRFPPLFIGQGQVDSIFDRYPYRHIGKNGQSILSKFPLLPIPLRTDEDDDAAFTAYRTNIYGHVMTIFNVHLQSLGLTTSDRELFLQMTSVDSKKSLAHIRSQLLDKLFDGFLQRAKQADRISLWVRAFDNTNILLCGDFNDVTLSYAYRAMERAGLKDAYSKGALGPTITYNDNRFYFHIDQIFYKGDFKVVKVERGDIPSSDHYPLLATLMWDQNLRRPLLFDTSSMPIDTTYYRPATKH